MLRAQAWWSCSFKRSWLHGFTLAFDVCFLGSKVKTWCRSSRGPHSNELCSIKHHFFEKPNRVFFLFFSASLWRQEEKSQGKLLLHCWCSTENSPAEELRREDFFLPATLTKEYQMKVGRKTATKSPNGTRSVLCVSLIFCLLQYFTIQGHIIYFGKVWLFLGRSNTGKNGGFRKYT